MAETEQRMIAFFCIATYICIALLTTAIAYRRLEVSGDEDWMVAASIGVFWPLTVPFVLLIYGAKLVYAKMFGTDDDTKVGRR